MTQSYSTGVNLCGDDKKKNRKEIESFSSNNKNAKSIERWEWNLKKVSKVQTWKGFRGFFGDHKSCKKSLIFRLRNKSNF